MTDATVSPSEADIYLKAVLADAAKTYISENAGPFTNEVLAYVSGVVDAQILALSQRRLKVTSV
jgi:hypothetical protein